MVTSAPGRGALQVPRPAIYLRSYPADTFQMECHRRALEELAWEAGLPEPVTYLDNGRRPADGLPARDSLLQVARAGLVATVLVTGLFVFSMDDADARAVAEELLRCGCRIVQLPARTTRTTRTTRAAPDHRTEPAAERALPVPV
ncbi:hypothetical protein ACFW1A_03510 [Kitasatospora sp. NPDC058965]|uniref:hypothetical protein n=1 Tax=Kitasatospora sp. NPDC058965 TaxID=3346682 RepID=UPI0036A760DB